MFQTSVAPLVKFTFALWGALMGTPTAAGFHSPLSGALRESQGLRERERQSRSVMGKHVADTHSFIDLRWPWLHWHDGLQGQTTIQGLSFSTSTIHFLKVRYFLRLNWFKPYQWGPNGKALHCLLLEKDSKGTFSEHCWSGNSRGKKHRAHPNPFIKDNHSGEMQQSISRVT